eukprot:5621047-Amphidinium_carterae.1
MASRKVWYQLATADEYDLDDVEVSNTATVNDVKAAIKEKNRLETGLPAMKVYVNEGGEPGRCGSTVVAAIQEVRDEQKQIKSELAKTTKPLITQTPNAAAEARRQNVLPEELPKHSSGKKLPIVTLRALKICGNDSHKLNLVMEKAVLGQILPKHVQLPGAVEILADECEKSQPLHERRLQHCLDDSKTKMLAFLGQGRFGRVFKVKRSNERLAMKVVDDVEKLKKELPVVEPRGGVVNLRNSLLTGGYFLMCPVGQPLTKQSIQDELDMLPKIFGILHALHQANVVHGDARIANIIKVGKKCRGVDFADAESTTDTGKTQDIVTLCCALGLQEEDVREQLKEQSLTDSGFLAWVRECISGGASSATTPKRRRIAVEQTQTTLHPSRKNEIVETS